MTNKPSICTSCSRRKGSIFCALPRSVLERMEREKLVYRYEPGQIIFNEGQPAFMVYHVYSGYVKLTKSGWGGEKLVIRLRGPGDIFGHRAVLAGEPYTADAMAIESTIVCAIQKEIFIQAIKDSSEFAFRVMARLSHDLRTSEEQTMSITHEDVRQRVARLLLFLIENIEGNRINQHVIPNSLLRSEMAQMIGTTPESFSRSLRYFADRKLINVTRKDIQIINRAGLRSFIPSIDLD